MAIHRTSFSSGNNRSIFSKRAFTGLDGNNNPTWSATETIIESVPIVNSDPYPIYGGGGPFGLTKSGQVVSYNVNKYDLSSGAGLGYHLGGAKNGKWLWRSMMATQPGYMGEYPVDGAYDIGNGINYGGGNVPVVSNESYPTYHGEGWKNLQVNKFAHFSNLGLYMGGFGATNHEYLRDPVTYRGFAGNVLGATGIEAPNGNHYLVHGEEYGESGIHFWKISNLSSRRRQVIAATVSNEPDPRGLPMFASLPRSTTLASGAVSGFVRVPATESGEYTVRTNALSYARLLAPDFYFQNNNASGDKYATVPFNTQTGLTSWKISFTLQATQYRASVGEYGDAGSGGGYIRILDNAGKTLVQYYQKEAGGSARNVGFNGVQAASSIQSYVPITLQALGSNIICTYGNNTPVIVPKYDATATLSSPAAIQVFSWINGENTGRIYGILDAYFQPVSVVIPTSLAITGADSVAEGASGSYRVIATLPGSLTADISSLATVTASRGASHGVTLTSGSPVTVASATNSYRGDNRFMKISATFGGQSVTREIVLKDATPIGTTSSAARFANSADLAKWPFMQTGDYIIDGGTPGFVTASDYSVQIRSSQSNVPTISPDATIWLKGAKYINFVVQLNLSRVPDGVKPIKIRNFDGQVVIRNSMQLLGAQGVKLSGKYEPGIGGDADYQGHATGYKFTHDRYGIMLDNEWTNSSTPGLMAISGSRNLEYEFIRVTGGYFAGMQINTDNYDDITTPGSKVHVPFDNLVVHDMLIDNVDSEGIYIGSTGQEDQKAFVSGKFYNNRLLFTGSENQWGQTKDVQVYNNVTLASLLWRDNFQQSQDNNLQLHARYPKALFKNNLALGAGDKFINGQSQADSLGDYSSVSADTIVFRNNAFLYNRGPVYGYFNTRTIYSTKKNPIVGMNLKFENNVFGFQRFTYNQVYSDKVLQAYMLQFDIMNAKISVLNNVFDGSSSTKTSWFTNMQAGTTTVTQSGNNLAGTVPAPDFENLAGDLDINKVARIEYWAASSANNYGSAGTLIKAPITYAIGELVVNKKYFYESKAANNAGIEPGVNATWKTYWNILYWNKATGLVVRNPVDLTGLSNMPPMDTRTKAGSFFNQRGIGLSN